MNKYIGVSLQKRTGMWLASITRGAYTVKLGAFPSDYEAAHAYDISARLLHGRKAKTNFKPEVAS